MTSDTGELSGDTIVVFGSLGIDDITVDQGRICLLLDRIALYMKMLRETSGDQGHLLRRHIVRCGYDLDYFKSTVIIHRSSPLRIQARKVLFHEEKLRLRHLHRSSGHGRRS